MLITLEDPLALPVILLKIISKPLFCQIFHVSCTFNIWETSAHPSAEKDWQCGFFSVALAVSVHSADLPGCLESRLCREAQ